MSQTMRLATRAFAFCSTTLLYAATVSVVPSVSSVAPGDLFSVAISGSAFAPIPLDAGGLDITWDPMVLTLGPSALTLAPGWNSSSTTGTAGSGSLTDIFFFADSAQGPNVNFGTLEFRAVAGGTSAVTLGESLLNPFAGGGGALAVTLSSGSVNVSGVPEPAGWSMVCGALVALLTFQRLRK